MQNKKNLLEIAQAFFKKGLTPIPCHAVVDGVCTCHQGVDCLSPGKHPALAWQRFQTKPIDEAQLDIWFGEGSKYAQWNIGLITGAISGNVFVIDVDCGDGKNGLESLHQLQMTYDDLPPTMETQTGGGGLHYFYRAPTGVRVTTDKNVLGSGIDIRGEGGFVVAAGSTHASGRDYLCDFDEIADAPEWLIPLVLENAEHTQHGRGIQAAHTGDNPFKVDDGREGVMIKVIISTICHYYEEHQELPAVEQIVELGYQKYVDRVTSRIGDLDKEKRGIKTFTQRARYQLSRARNGQLNRLTELKAEIASRDPRSAPAQVSRAATSFAVDYEDWEVVPEPKEPTAPAASHEQKGLKLGDWKIKRYVGKAPETVWLIENRIPAGIPMLLAAVGGLGKSFLALDLALKIAGGGAQWDDEAQFALGGQIKNFGKVVFLTAEDSSASVHRRLDAISTATLRERANENLIIVPLPDAGGAFPWIVEDATGIHESAGYVDVREQIIAMGDVALIIIDPLQAFVHADITANPAAAQFWWSQMSELCAITGAVVLVAHHMRKDGAFTIKTAADARQAIRGTTALVDGARLVYGLWTVGDEEDQEICRLLNLEHSQGNIVRGAVLKANDYADMSLSTFKRTDSGLLTDCTAQVEDLLGAAAKLNPEQQKTILREVGNRWTQGQPFSANQRSKVLTLQFWISQAYALSRRAADQMVSDWIANQFIVAKKNPVSGLPGLALSEAGATSCQRGERYGE